MTEPGAESTDFYHAIPSSHDAILNQVPESCQPFVEYQLQGIKFCMDEIAKHREKLMHQEAWIQGIHKRLEEGQETMNAMQAQMTTGLGKIEKTQRHFLYALIGFMSTVILTLIGVIISLSVPGKQTQTPTKTVMEVPYAPSPDPIDLRSPPVCIKLHPDDTGRKDQHES